VKVLDLGFCPRCKEPLQRMKSQVVQGVRFCWLCGWDIREEHTVRRWVRWAKSYAEAHGVEAKEVEP